MIFNILKFKYNNYLIPFFGFWIYYINKVLFEKCKKFDYWTLADWLISYGDGVFRRRGFTGSIAFFLQDITHINLEEVVYLLQNTCYISFFIGWYLLLKNKLLNTYYFALMVMPTCLQLYANDYGIVGRKEIILYTFFVWYIIIKKYDLLNKTVRLILFFCIAFCATLSHELFTFYILYFVFADYLLCKSFDIKNYYSSIIVSIGSVLAFVIVYFFGKQINGINLVETLVERGISPSIKKGILTYPENYDTISHHVKYIGVTINYSTVALAMLLLFCLYAYFYLNDKRIIIGLFICFLFSVPLFIVAIDWGRWISIHVFLTLILFAIKLPESNWNSVSHKNLTWQKIFTVKHFLVFVFYFLITNFYYIFHCSQGFATQAFNFLMLLKTFILLIFSIIILHQQSIFNKKEEA